MNNTSENPNSATEAEFNEAPADESASETPRHLTSAERQQLYKQKADEKLRSDYSAQKAKKIRRNVIIAVSSFIAVCTVAALIVLNSSVWTPRRNYKEAYDLFEKEEYIAAYDAFLALGDYSDSAEMADKCILFNARKLSGKETVNVGDTKTMPWFSIDVTGTLGFDDSAYKGPSDIVIPDVFDGILVKSIGAKAFYYCDYITSVSIPASVTSLGERSFFNCSNLTEIIIPDGVTLIDEYCFSGCASLTSLTIGSGMKEIRNRAFRGCTALETVTIPEGVTEIGVRAFNGCTALKSITLPKSLLTVGGYAFTECTALESVTFNGAIGVLKAAMTSEDADVILLCPGLECLE